MLAVYTDQGAEWPLVGRRSTERQGELLGGGHLVELCCHYILGPCSWVCAHIKGGWGLLSPSLESTLLWMSDPGNQSWGL